MAVVLDPGPPQTRSPRGIRGHRRDHVPNGSGPGRLPAQRLVDACLPEFDAKLVRRVVVDAPPAVTFRAIREANILDRLTRALFLLRELPQRLGAWLRMEPWPAVPRRVTFADLLERVPRPAVLAEEKGVELVVGSVGRFWRKDYGALEVSGAEFLTFHEPGYARLAMSFRVEPLADGRSLLRYEARTATTDGAARRSFRRYWRLIRPGVALVMGRALSLIRGEAETRWRDQREDLRLVQRYLPDADHRARHETVVRAPAQVVFETACDLDLQAHPLVRAIFWLRGKLLGSTPSLPRAPRGLIEETLDLGWGVLSRRPGREIVMGAVTRPWEADVVFRAVPPDDFPSFLEPGLVKIAWTLEAEPLGPELTRFRTETRALATDDRARRRFARYWLLVGTGILAIRALMLPRVRREAERRWRLALLGGEPGER